MVQTNLKVVHSEDNDLPVTRCSMLKFAEDPIVMMKELYHQHGEVSAIQDDAFRIYFAFGQKYNQQILSDHEHYHSRFFAIRGGKKSAQRRLTLGLLSMNGEQHKRHRRMVKEPFSKKTIMSYRDDIAYLAEELVSSKWNPGQTIDLNAEMTHYMLRVVSGILFGLDDPEIAYETGEMIDKWVGYNHDLGPLAFAPHPELADKYDEMLQFGEKLEQRVREIINRRKQASHTSNDVLSLLIKGRDAKGGITDDELVGHVTLLFAAAHMTTAHTMSWMMFLLAQHPDIMQTLHSELDHQLEGRIPELADIDKMPFLDKVLKESMRILPASSYSQRITTQPVELGPFKVRENSIIIFSQFMTHHMSSCFKEPDSFNPARWENFNPPPYTYIPFGGGPRLCLGAMLATEIVKVTVPAILQKYRLSVQPESEINAKVISTMLCPTTPIMTTLHEQDLNFASSPISGNIHSLVNFPPLAGRESIRRAA